MDPILTQQSEAPEAQRRQVDSEQPPRFKKNMSFKYNTLFFFKGERFPLDLFPPPRAFETEKVDLILPGWSCSWAGWGKSDFGLCWQSSGRSSWRKRQHFYAFLMKEPWSFLCLFLTFCVRCLLMLSPWRRSADENWRGMCIGRKTSRNISSVSSAEPLVWGMG